MKDKFGIFNNPIKVSNDRLNQNQNDGDIIIELGNEIDELKEEVTNTKTIKEIQPKERLKKGFNPHLASIIFLFLIILMIGISTHLAEGIFPDGGTATVFSWLIFLFLGWKGIEYLQKNSSCTIGRAYSIGIHFPDIKKFKIGTGKLGNW